MSEELNLRQAAERLIYWCNRIEHASLEAEINECCAERDKILALFRKADADRAPPTSEGGREDIVERARKHEECVLLEGCENHALILEMAGEIERLRLLSSPRVEDVRREALEEAAKVAEALAAELTRLQGSRDRRVQIGSHLETCATIAAGIRTLSTG